MNLTKPILAGALAVCGLLPAHGQLIINEVMQSNVYSIMDDLNDFPDSWVELYNAGDAPVFLGDYKINTKEKIKSAYTLPAVNLGPGEVYLVYCDKVGEGRHASMRIDSGKGDVYLFDADDNVADKVTLKKQPAPEVAYGRESNGSEVWGYELTPTPGEANGGGLTEDVLGNVKFSTPGGVWATPQSLTVALELPNKAPEGAYIVFTTDGSEPAVDNGSIYSEPISVMDNTVIRAKAFAEGCISIPSAVQSYIFLGREMQLPVVSIVVDNDYFYDETIGILAEGTGGWMSENFRNDWRRPINVEYFTAEGEVAAINQLCETRVQGGMSRNNALKSLAVYANKRFGVKNFGVGLWPEDKPGLVTSKSIILRNAGNDFDGCYMRDGLIQRVIGRNTDIDWQAYSPVIVFVNGQYHAMMALRERSNEDYVEANYDGLEDIDMFENWEECKAGDEKAMEEFSDFVYGDHTFDEWAEYVNVKSFANLMAVNYWVYNSDFPMNNVVMWRRTDGVDGRWQWLVKDCDYGLGIWNDDSFVHSDFDRFLYSNVAPYVGFDVYQRMMLSDFRQYYIDHLVVYMGDFLNARTFHQYKDEILDAALDEMRISHRKWGSSWSKLDENLAFMDSWIDEREAYMPTLMQESWGLGAPVKVSVNMSQDADKVAAAEICYNDIPLTRGVFNGFDYTGRTIKLSAAEGMVKAWTVTVDGVESTVNNPVLTYNIDSDKDITINAVFTTTIQGIDVVSSSIKMVGDTVFADGKIEAFDATGRKVAEGLNSLRLTTKGIYIVLAGDKTAKFIW